MSAASHGGDHLEFELRQLRQRVRELEHQIRDQGAASAPCVPTATADAGPPRSDRDITILIIDDDEAKRYIWARALSSAGLRITHAPNGREALSSLEREIPDLVLLDVNLPDMSGFELCNRMKGAAATARIPVVLVSAVFTSGRDHVRGLEGGAEAYLSGEVDPDVVVATVRALIGMRRAMKEKEDALALLSALTNAAPVGLAFFDRDLRFQMVNEHLADINGVPAEEHLGRTVAEVLPAMGDFALRMYDTVMKTGRPALDEDVAVVTPKRPGELRHFSENWYPVRSGDGSLIGVGAVVVDTTERRRLEEAVRMSEERLRIALDAAAMGTWTVDPATARVQVSERSRSIHGFTSSVLDLESALSVIHPDDRERVSAAVRRSVEDKVSYDEEYRIVLPRGECRWVASWGRLMETSAGALIFGIAQDITSRKQGEEELLDSQRRIRESDQRFRRLVESNIIGIVTAGVDGIKAANDVFLRMIGASRQDLDDGRIDWINATPPDQFPKDLHALAELREKGWCKPYEKDFVHPDGSRTPVLIGAAALGTEPLEWICFVIDLTEQKGLETRLRETQKLESIGLLAGGIAHDFNNLLVGIIGNASLGQDMVPPRSPVRPVLDAIVKAGERAAHLTREMLAYSGKGRFVLEHLDISETVGEVTSLLRSSIPSRVTVHFDLASGLPRVEADPGQMQQLIMNLVLNAAEAIATGSGTVSIRTGVCSIATSDLSEFPELHPGAYVSIEVSDTGCGMDAETKAKIFDPFFTTKFTGRGLGLSAVSGIVRGHGGAIHVTTTPEAGSTFLVLLPAAAVRMETVLAETVALDLQGTGLVLVVDDEEVVRETARRALERQGYTVLLAESGPSALEVFARERGRISLVVLDLGMPGMDGHETLRELQKIKGDVQALISSGYTEAECLRLFAGEKICGFIEKPYTSAGLAGKVKAAISAAA